MAEVKVPDMGESISEGTLIKWYVKKGDRVTQGDLLAELETDKVNVEINAEMDGHIEDIHHSEGDTVEVGQVIATMSEGSPSNAESTDSKDSDASASDSPISEEGSRESEQDKSEANGSSRPDQNRQQADDMEAYYATPSARKYAREHGIRLGDVEARDPYGRLKKEDVREQHRKQQSSSGASSSEENQTAEDHAPKQTSQKRDQASESTSAQASGQKTQPSNKDGASQDEDGIKRERMSRRRQTIAKRLVDAQHQSAMLTTFNEVDMTAILDLRKRRKDRFQEKHDVKLGFMSFFTKAVIGALKAYPRLNAEIDGEDMLIKSFYDIGIAVSAKEGLVVPVLRDADRKSFAELEQEIAELARKAQENKLTLRELQGGSFTITNGGVFGSLLSTPILNPPQVGILGMHKIQLRPIAIDEERMENRPMMYIALSYDHRIVDGAEAVQFLVRLKELLEDPEALMLEG
ncbi:2-oxoglutarate dehydrogenase complex dihydrolipoyllysine-residue succinyltransferase [Marinicrinis sediminis]|uniref:Dihydrolipoyllysine-residue succinyltransferase component of 2-oxoglutarate dehydrogenase complex n=1 Tax=Marinicrinis sediminis TaxID=1652465 RepID=A0ABW5R6C5_9BACL